MKNVMKLICTMLLTMTVQSVLLAQDFFPEGTKWTEIRLDTLMYDSWYSKSGDEWVPNFETVEYYVKGDSVSKWPDIQRRYSCVFTTGPLQIFVLSKRRSTGREALSFHVGSF